MLHLVLPSEFSNRFSAVNEVVDHGHAAGSTVVALRFLRSQQKECAVWDSVYEPEAEERRGAAMGGDRRVDRNRLGLKTFDRVILNERAAVVRHRIEHAIGHFAEARDHALASSAD